MGDCLRACTVDLTVSEVLVLVLVLACPVLVNITGILPILKVLSFDFCNGVWAMKKNSDDPT